MSDCGGSVTCAENDTIYLSNCKEIRLVNDSIACTLRNGNACYDPSAALPDACMFTKSNVSDKPLIWRCYSSGSNVERSPNAAGFFTQTDLDRCVVIDPAKDGTKRATIM